MVRYVYPPFQTAELAVAAIAKGHVRRSSADRILDRRIGIERMQDFDGTGVGCRCELTSLPERFRKPAAGGVASNRVGDGFGDHAALRRTVAGRRALNSPGGITAA